MVGAQEFTDSDLSLSLSSAFPRSGERIVLSLDTNSFDLNTASVAWYQNDKLIKQGVGVKEFIIDTLAEGKTTIRVAVETTDSAGEASVTLHPGLVSLSWQSDSYVHPFYKGKSTLSPQGTLTFIALPFFSRRSGSLGSNERISYTWKKDGQVFGEKSGFGKDTFTVETGILVQPVTVEVTAENLETGEIGQDRITVYPEETSVVLYENHPLRGVLFNKALGKQVTLVEPEISLFAVPFATSRSSFSALAFNWSMNDTELTEKKRGVTFRTSAEVSGTSEISLALENPKETLQRALTDIRFTYKAPQKSIFNTSNQ